MTNEDIQNVIDKLQANPIRYKDYEDFKKIGLDTEYLDSGSYRHAYRLLDFPLVIKIDNYVTKHQQHSYNEYKVYKKIIESDFDSPLYPIKKHLPEIYYFQQEEPTDDKPGFAITLMRYYQHGMKESDTRLGPLVRLVADAVDTHTHDVRGDNVREYDGKLVIIDLGNIRI
jgi:hypothetical protein